MTHLAKPSEQIFKTGDWDEINLDIEDLIQSVSETQPPEVNWRHTNIPFRFCYSFVSHTCWKVVNISLKRNRKPKRLTWCFNGISVFTFGKEIHLFTADSPPILSWRFQDCSFFPFHWLETFFFTIHFSFNKNRSENGKIIKVDKTFCKIVTIVQHSSCCFVETNLSCWEI